MSEVKVNKISPRSGTAITLGDSGDTFTIPSGATLAIAGSVTGFTSAGIDDNATSVAITIDSSERVGIGITSPLDQLSVLSSGIGRVRFAPASGSVSNLLLSGVTTGDSGFQFNSNQFNMFSYGDIAFFPSTSNISGSYPNGEVMRIRNTGNVGIGTSSPSQKLHVEGSGTTNAIIKSTGSSTASSVGAENNSGTVGKILMYGSSQGAFGSLGSGEMALYSDSAGMSIMNNNASGAIKFSLNSGAEQMRLTSTGLGIGTTSPANNLHIFTDGSGEGILVKSTGNTYNDIIGDANRSSAGNNLVRFRGNWNGNGVAMIALSAGDDTTNKDDGRIEFFTSASGSSQNNRMVIEPNGVVGIGTTSPSSSYRLSAVGGTGAVVGAFIETTSTDSGHEASIIKRPNSGVLVQFLGSGQVGSITTNGSTTTYGTSSDYRLKENVVDLNNATERLKQLQPKRFNFISDADTTVDGFIAHEVSSVVPEAIHGTKDEVDANGNPKYQNIDQSKLVPLLVKTIQELEARITTLEANNP